MKNAQLVLGPAGSGKSTYCTEIHKYISQTKYSPKIINLDPSIENIEYPNSIDIRDLINATEVMEEYFLGPNGSLVFCMEYLMDNLQWLEYEINSCFDDYFIFDLPGQIEIYLHNNLIKELIVFLNNKCNLNFVALFLMDCQFIVDIGKFFSGNIIALTCMISSDIPHFNILNKIDLIKNIPKKLLERFLYPNSTIMIDELNLISNVKYKKLTFNIAKLLEDFSMIHYIPLDLTSLDSVNSLFQLISQSLTID